MKKIISTILILSFTTFFGQNLNENTPWKDVSTKKAFKQGEITNSIINIKIKGKNTEECKLKAEKAAVYIVLFEGYDANVERNIPAGLPLTKESVYDSKLDFFNRFFETNGKYKSYISTTDFHPTEIPETKIDKRTVEANLIVTVKKKSLYDYLSDPELGIIKPTISSDVPPATVLVIPDDSYLDTKGYVKEIDAGGYMTTTYNLVSGAKDQGIETAIAIIASQLTGEGTGLQKLELGDAQSAIEKKDALTEMESGSRKQKTTPSERLKNTANWDYSVKVNVKEEKSGSTGVSLTVELKIVDMYTNTSETALPITMILSSGGDRKQQVQKVLAGAIDELRVKIGKKYQARIDKGIAGKVNFYAKGKDFDTQITIGDKPVALKVQVGKMIKSLSSKETPPSLDGADDPVIVKYKDVLIPFWTTTTDDEGQAVKEKNNFSQLGIQLQEKFAKQIPNAKVVYTSSLGTLDFYIDLK